MISPGFSIGREHFALGSVFEIEVNIGWFDSISMLIGGGYQILWSDWFGVGDGGNAVINPTGNISLLYNF